MNYTKIYSDLNACGFHVQDCAFSVEFCQKILNEVSTLDVQSAGIGAKKEVNSDIRQDKIRWLDSLEGETVAEYFNKIKQLQTFLREKTFLPLINFECHYAKYEQGGFYKPHYDNVQGKNNRLLTAILYLNEKWSPGCGGELVAYPKGEEPLRVQPKAGTFIIFDSTDLLHEVLPSFSTRQSVTGWMTR